MTGPTASLQRKNALILGAILLAALPFGAEVAAGAAVGGLVQVLNLRALERGVAALLGLAGRGHGAAAQLLLGARFLALLAVVALALLALPVSPFGVAAGLSSAVPAALWHGLEHARAAPRRGAA